MLMMKSCPRCSGDLLRTTDPSDDEPLFSCVQCGYASYRAAPVLSVASNVEAEREAVTKTGARTAASSGLRRRLAAQRAVMRGAVKAA
jgi:DNA-directed RNA polymerase subunit M/transcription elongation factor TFIIS